VPRRARTDTTAVSEVLAPGRAVASHRELRSLGVPASTITSRIGPQGSWQRVLPGVVVGHRGTLTSYERRLAAVRYGGAGAVLTGLDALHELGVPVPAGLRDARVHVLVPHDVQRSSHGFALVTRTRRPGPVVVRRDLPCVPVARAVVDACRRFEDIDSVRALVAGAVQQRRCTTAELVAEVRDGPRQRTALVRAVLREVAAGVRSVAEARLRAAFTRCGVPPPQWNATARRPGGEAVAVVDALWEDLGVAVELDSMAWHLSPADYRRTQARQRRLVAAGFTVVPVAPGDVDARPEQICQELLVVLRAAAARRGVRLA
jgi:hypothetical protein